MNVGYLLLKVRRRLRDVTVHPSEQLWTDDELIDEYANEIRRKLFRKLRGLILDSTTTVESLGGAAVCAIPVVAGTSKYAINSNILEIERAQFTTLAYPLDERDVNWMDQNIINWKYDTTQGTPYIYVPDLDSGYLFLYPVPNATLTLNLTLKRMPFTDLTAASLSADLGFSYIFQDAMISGIMQLAFEKKDAQTDRPEQAAFYKKVFEDEVDELKITLWRQKYGSTNQRLRWANMAK